MIPKTSFFILYCMCLAIQLQAKDIYVILFATYNGQTGHIGLAVDNYNIYISENENNTSEYDTLSNATLTYFDFWPATDDFDKIRVNIPVEGRFEKVPGASYEPDLTLYKLYKSSLYGLLDHIGYEQTDGILRISTSPAIDYQLYQVLDSISTSERAFSVREYNCADFVEECIETVLSLDIYADEFIPYSFSTTPNKLFRKLKALPRALIIKDPGKKAEGSFWREKLVKGELLNNN